MELNSEQAVTRLAQVRTKEELADLISSIDVSVPGEITLLYSGAAGFNPANQNTLIGSREIALSIAASHENIRVVNNSEVARFLAIDPRDPNQNTALVEKLIEIFNDNPNMRGSVAYQFLHGEVIEGQRVPNGVWDAVSARFVAEAQGEVRTLTGGATPDRVFAMTEIPALLRNQNVTHVDGITIETLRAASLEDAFQMIRAESEAFSSQIMVAVDSNGTPVDIDGIYQVDGSHFFSEPVVIRERVSPLPDGLTMKPVADFIPRERLQSHSGGYEQLLDAKHHVEVELGQLSGPGTEARRVHLLKSLDRLGTAVEILGLTMVALEAGDAYAAGETDHANKILLDWAIENAGGLLAGRLAALALAPLLAAGAPGVLVAGALTLMASMVGSEYADDLINWMLNIFNPWNEDFRYEFEDLFIAASGPMSPLIVDLDGDNVETIGLSDSFIYFDHDANGMAEHTGWVSPDDGLIVLDRNGNGTIDNGTELFGDNTVLSNGEKAANGFEAIKEFDDNLDGVINNLDSSWDRLRIWQDHNSDAKVDDGEIYTLEQKNVRGLNTDYIDAVARYLEYVELNGNNHRMRGSYTTVNGSVQNLTDVWFLVDKSRTVDLNTAPVTPDIAALPNMPGIGNLPSLHQAMMRDPSGRLKSLVEDWAHGTWTERAALIQPLIFRWAGVENADPADYGNDQMDARQIAVLEVMKGRDFPNRVESTFWEMILARKNAFDMILEKVESGLIQQTDMASIFSSLSLSYDPQSSLFSLTSDQILDLFEAKLGHPDYLEDFFALGQALRRLDAESLRNHLVSDLKGISEEVDWTMFSALFILDAEELMKGTSEADYLYFHEGDAWLSGGAGNDRITGGLGDQIINGGPGLDILYGGWDSDIFRFGRGDDIDVLYGLQPYPQGQNSRLRFNPGVEPANVEISPAWEGGGVALRISGSDDQVILPEINLGDPSTYYMSPIQVVDFSGSVTFDFEEMLDRYTSKIVSPSYTFGQVITLQDLISAPQQVGEYGTAQLNHNWQTVTLTGTYTSPVVIAGDPSHNGPDPATVRIRNAGPASFEMRLQEPNSMDGSHTNETVSWLVVEAGEYELSDGTRLSAGTTNTNRLSPQGFETVGFTAPFAERPTVLSQIQTFNGPDWVLTRTDAITGNSFKLTMQEEETLNSGSHASETIGWLAIDPSDPNGTADDGDTLLAAGTTAAAINHSPTQISFSAPSGFFSEPPALLAKLSSFHGSDPANLRLSGISSDGFTALAKEEQSADAELNHVFEQGSWLALAGGPGTIEALSV